MIQFLVQKFTDDFTEKNVLNNNRIHYLNWGKLKNMNHPIKIDVIQNETFKHK